MKLKFAAAVGFIILLALANSAAAQAAKVAIGDSASAPTNWSSGSPATPCPLGADTGKRCHHRPDRQHAGTAGGARSTPQILRSFVKSHIEAVHRLTSDRALGMKIAAKYLRPDDNDLLQGTYDSSIDENKLPAKQYPNAKGIKTILDELVLKEPKTKNAKPADFIDARFVEEFDKSGYTESLCGREK